MFRVLVGLVMGSTLLMGSAMGPADPRAPAGERKAAPDFSLADAQGKAIQLSHLRGKVVLIDFWATWCHGCQTEIPWFMEFQNKYGSNGLAVVGIAMDDDGWKAVKPFLAARKINYTVVVGNKDIEKLYSVENPPVAVLIDRAGKIAEVHEGVVERESFEKQIKSLLDESR